MPTLLLQCEYSTCKVDQRFYRKLITNTTINGRLMGLVVDLEAQNYHLGGVDSMLCVRGLLEVCVKIRRGAILFEVPIFSRQ